MKRKSVAWRTLPFRWTPECKYPPAPEKQRPDLGTCRRTKKAVEYEGDGNTDCNWRT